MKTNPLYLLIAILFFLPQEPLRGQIVVTQPALVQDEGAVTITFDLSQTAMAGYASDDVYVHTGLITDLSTSDSDWRYATTWLDNSPQYKLTKDANDRWTLSISPNLRAYYAVEADEQILKLAFVVRNSDGSREAKDKGKDFFLPVYGAGLQIKITQPSDARLLSKGEALNITTVTTAEASIRLYLNDSLVYLQPNTTQINYQYTFLAAGTYTLFARADDGKTSSTDSISLLVKKDISQQPMPPNTRVGINYVDDSTATFVLYAPYKEDVYLIGDFNNWTIDNAYQLNKDGDHWWITLSDLEKGKEYAFQYFVDGSLLIADPYTNKILDPANDPYIPTSVYPDLKPYPTGKTEGIVAIVQTGQEEYQWQVTDFEPVSKEKLVIYELLIRDFTPQHSFQSTIDKLDYLQTLGINAIELLPINEFEGNSSWGYNPSFYFAVDKYYGTANAFRQFVDQCHARGIAVIIDMVLNHSFSQSPFARLYWNDEANKVAVNNPWYNVDSPNTAYSWGSDFNHQSQQTQQLVDSINSYWMSEYKVDGFRFDFTKGFTNTQGDGWAYDQARIDILKRMNEQILRRNPHAIVILEHLTDNSEEKVLAEADMLLWGNLNYNYSEAIMGYTEDNKTDLSWGIYTNRGWTKPNLVAYMESHDEERIMYKAETWGKVTDVDKALTRAQLAAAFYLLQPGAKMIWQFGELGYDYSINTCSDGVTITDDCRVAEKPIRWDYFDDPERKALYEAYSKLIAAKNKYEVFQSTDLNYSLHQALKYIVWKGQNQNAFLVGNFDTQAASISLTLPRSGEWVDLMTQETLFIPNTDYQLELQAGEYRLFADKGALTSIEQDAPSDEASVRISQDYVDYLRGQAKSITIYTLSGSIVKTQKETDFIPISDLPQGVYIVKVEDSNRTISQKFVK